MGLLERLSARRCLRCTVAADSAGSGDARLRRDGWRGAACSIFLPGEGLEREDDDAGDKDLDRPIAAAAKGTAAAAEAAAESFLSLVCLRDLRVSESEGGDVAMSLSRRSIFFVSFFTLAS